MGSTVELSVKSNQTDRYFISPNPVQDYVNISGNDIDLISIYDVQGRVMFAETGHFDKIDMSYLPKGFYFLRIVSNKGTVYIKKIIKQ